MREKIIEELHDIEQNHGVKVLYACESGSRAWGFESQDSDWDVRFIYVHPLEWYLKFDVGYKKLADTINRIDRETNLDFIGWDLKKTMWLYSKGNPHLFEYLRSPVKYIDGDSIVDWLRNETYHFFSKTKSIYHYFHMARNNFERYLQDDVVSYKKYLYVLRPLLCCRWIQEYQTTPPVEFESLMYEFIKDRNLLMQITLLLNKKRKGLEMDSHPKIPEIHNYLVSGLDYFDAYTQKMARTDTDKDMMIRLNRAFCRYVQGLPMYHF